MQVHAVGLWTGLVLHEVWAVLGGAERGLERAVLYGDVIDGGYSPQRVVRSVVGHVRAGAGPLRYMPTLRRTAHMSGQARSDTAGVSTSSTVRSSQGSHVPSYSSAGHSKHPTREHLKQINTRQNIRNACPPGPKIEYLISLTTKHEKVEISHEWRRDETLSLNLQLGTSLFTQRKLRSITWAPVRWWDGLFIHGQLTKRSGAASQRRRVGGDQSHDSPANRHTACYGLSQLYGFCRICRNIHVALTPETRGARELNQRPKQKEYSSLSRCITQLGGLDLTFTASRSAGVIECLKHDFIRVRL